LPLLVSDGSSRYLHAGGILAEIDAANAARYHLTDALGSVRGVTDGTGALVGTSDYAAFGAVRATTGTTSRFGYTGEQTDPETGNSYLRARYLDPELGRFLSMDTVQPNAPGTQGYNRCSYAANNPATWTDPSGNTSNWDWDAGCQTVVMSSRIGAFWTLWRADIRDNRDQHVADWRATVELTFA
jgi:RHS repeat-associated protein